MKEVWSSDCQFQKEAWLHPGDKCLRKWLINTLLSLAIPSEQRTCLHSECQLLWSPPWAPISHPFCVGSFCTVSVHSYHDTWTMGNIQSPKTPTQPDFKYFSPSALVSSQVPVNAEAALSGYIWHQSAESILQVT